MEVIEKTFVKMKQQETKKPSAGKKVEEAEESKAQCIQKMTEKIEKDLKIGKGIIFGLNDKAMKHDVISTGSIGLNKALGIGGLPKGRIVEIYGPESSGKTTIALHVIAEAHRNPTSWCAFVDMEHAFDEDYARAIGVDIDRLKIAQPEHGEQALDITDLFIKSDNFDVIVVDSVAALVTKKELDGVMGDATMGGMARMMGQALRKLTPIVGKSSTLLIFINQLREKIGSMGGNPETTTGGNALKFYASVRLDIRRSIAKDNLIMDGDDVVATPTTVKVVKNKCAPPFKKCAFNMKFGKGIDKFAEIIDIAIDMDIIKKAGSWFSYNGDNIAQGRIGTIAILEDNQSLFEEIMDKVIKTYVPKNMTKEERIKAEKENGAEELNNDK